MTVFSVIRVLRSVSLLLSRILSPLITILANVPGDTHIENIYDLLSSRGFVPLRQHPMAEWFRFNFIPNNITLSPNSLPLVPGWTIDTATQFSETLQAYFPTPRVQQHLRIQVSLDDSEPFLTADDLMILIKSPLPFCPRSCPFTATSSRGPLDSEVKQDLHDSSRLLGVVLASSMVDSLADGLEKLIHKKIPQDARMLKNTFYQAMHPSFSAFALPATIGSERDMEFWARSTIVKPALALALLLRNGHLPDLCGNPLDLQFTMATCSMKKTDPTPDDTVRAQGWDGSTATSKDGVVVSGEYKTFAAMGRTLNRIPDFSDIRHVIPWSTLSPTGINCQEAKVLHQASFSGPSFAQHSHLDS